ncbi:MAG: hypothetical protein C4582_03955 [Desulfobacteraceae bacterium]|nr:MAG: hypothetical protein C4582_03955 [Desulfobacteraceae bacterium]
MVKDDALGGKGEAGKEMLEFEFDDLPEDPLTAPGRMEFDEDIIELVNPVKKGVSPDRVFDDVPEKEAFGKKAGGEVESKAMPGEYESLGSLDKEIEEIFSRAAGFESPAAEPNHLDLDADNGYLLDKTRGDDLAAAGISEERLEAIIARAVNEAVERVARQAVEAAAERAIKEAIEALRESLRIPRV